VIVVDASAVLEVLVQTPAASYVADRLFAPGESLHAPHLLDVEVAQVVRRYGKRGGVRKARRREMLQDLRRMPLERYGHRALLGRVWELREHVTAYDAAYLALAEALGCPLVTRDARLASAGGHRAQIDVL
jgi:predicted nucleic acid-binding protein